jgi:hypothetical protein
MQSAVSLSATSSNQALVPDANISFGGRGVIRKMHLRTADGESGTANIRITLCDGDQTSTKVLTVKIGTNGVDAINGTARADALFGLGAVDALNGREATICCAAAKAWTP